MNKIIKTRNSNSKTISLIESVILVIAIFAFAWMIGSEFKIVSAASCDNIGGICKTTCSSGETVKVATGCAVNKPICCVASTSAGNTDDENTGNDGSNNDEDNENSLNAVAAALAPIMGIWAFADKLLASKVIKGMLGKPTTDTTTTATTPEVAPGAEVTEPPVTTEGGNFLYNPEATVSALGSSVAIVAMAFAAYGGITWFLKKMGVAWENYHTLERTALASAIGVSVVGIVLSYTTTIFVTGGILSGTIAMIPVAGWIAAAVVILVTAIVAGLTYQDFSVETFTYLSQPWKPNYGGENCEKCNDLEYGCSEYECHSFGSACGIVNAGTKDEQCEWLNPNDHLSPDITLNQDVLNEQDLKSKPLDITLPSQEKGFEILPKQSGEDCIAPFTEIKIGLITNELAECKFDILRNVTNYEDMLSYMEEGNALLYNHTLIIPAAGSPSSSALENLGIELENGLEYLFYFKCRDMNKNTNNANFIIKFCIDDGPDTHAPIIKGTSVTNPVYISNNQTSAEIEVYTNEPADCKWDFKDTSYELMDYNMTECSSQIYDYLTGFDYGCKTNLTGIKKEQRNNYYIKCKDQPWLESDEAQKHLRKANPESYVQVLIGTSSLLIDSLKVNDEDTGSIIKDSTSPVQVRLVAKTSNGAEEGKSKCMYSFDGYEDYFTNGGQFWQETDLFRVENYQDLFLDIGDYNISVSCFDIGGNYASDFIEFSVEQDLQAPAITRAYYEEGDLKLITNEEAECVYSLFNEGCNYLFADGNVIGTTDNINHLLAWSTDSEIYIKCKDNYGNLPEPGQCSIKVLGSEDFQEQ